LKLGTSEIEFKIESLSVAGKILFQLPFGLHESGIVAVFGDYVQSETLRMFILPKGSPPIHHSKQQASGFHREKGPSAYIHNLAEWFDANRSLARKLATLPDNEVVEALTTITRSDEPARAHTGR
jgi:hypothetical protein